MSPDWVRDLPKCPRSGVAAEPPMQYVDQGGTVGTQQVHSPLNIADSVALVDAKFIRQGNLRSTVTPVAR